MVLSDKITIIKKVRICFSCHRKFAVNAKMHKWACIFESTFCFGYTCLICGEIHRLVPKNWIEDGIPDGFVNDILEKDQTPENLLLSLKTKVHATKN